MLFGNSSTNMWAEKGRRKFQPLLKDSNPQPLPHTRVSPGKRLKKNKSRWQLQPYNQSPAPYVCAWWDTLKRGGALVAWLSLPSCYFQLLLPSQWKLKDPHSPLAMLSLNKFKSIVCPPPTLHGKYLHFFPSSEKSCEANPLLSTWMRTRTKSAETVLIDQGTLDKMAAGETGDMYITGYSGFPPASTHIYSLPFFVPPTLSPIA